MRTNILLAAVAALVLAAAPASSAKKPESVGDFLGELLKPKKPPPGQDEPAPPQPAPPPDQSPPAAVERPAPASASKPTLLAPESVCPGQLNRRLPTVFSLRTMVCMHNYARRIKGLSILRVSKPLQLSATRKAFDIQRCQHLSHSACGRDPWFWMNRVGFASALKGENLALGYGRRGTVRATMEAWLRSGPHRKVLFHPRFTLIGIGTATGRFRGYRGAAVWVAHFGYR